MLYRVFGHSGSGKTSYMIECMRSALESGYECVCIVPEQIGVQTQRLLCRTIEPQYSLRYEVLEFVQLPNRIARQYGGLSKKYIDAAGKNILMSLTLEKLSRTLVEYRQVAAVPELVTEMISLINRLKEHAVTPEKLEYTLAMLDKDSETDIKLRNKLRDICMIYREYNSHFDNDFADPGDGLTRVAERLEHDGFFKNKHVFINGFYVFTEQELNVIKHIVLQSEAVYISFILDNNDNRDFFIENKKLAHRIKAFSPNGCRDIDLGQSKHSSDAWLGFVERNIWGKAVYSGNEQHESIKVIECRNAFEESEAAAAEIFRLIRDKKCRYRDITIALGNTDGYDGILDAVFEKYGIPFYFSAKDDLSVKPLMTAFFALLEIAISDFSTTSIKKYLSSGYSGLDTRVADILISYVNTWSIRGNTMWGSDEGWMMNPDGYKSNFTDYNSQVLYIVNKARIEIANNLIPLYELLTSKGLTVNKAVRALYNHLIEVKADSAFSLDVARLRSEGREEESQRQAQVWDILIGMLDQLSLTCGDSQITAARLRELCSLMCAEHRISSIQNSVDEVNIGGAFRLRSERAKYVLVIGTNDGVFPAAVTNSGLFDRNELAMLEEHDCEISESPDKQMNYQRFYFYAVCAMPSEELIFLYSDTDLGGAKLRRSSGLNNIMGMFENLKVKRFGLDERDYLFCKKAALSHYPLITDAALKNHVKTLLTAQGESPYEATEDCRLSVKTARLEKSEADRISLSPSRLDRYVYCGFSYFGRYILKLRDNRKAAFSSLEIGNFIHEVLERFVRQQTASGSFIRPSSQDIEKTVDTLTDEYILKVVGSLSGKSKRFKQIFIRLKHTLALLLDNISEELESSLFIPTEFEYRIGIGNEGIPSVEFKTDDNVTVDICGMVDRIDLYKNGKNTYVRVIDYKTGDKKFSLRYIQAGLDLQMLIYLFAYCSHDKSGNTLPAGVLYLPARLPAVKIDVTDNEEKRKDKIKKGFARSGLVLDDGEIICAMTTDTGKNFIPASFNANGTLSYSSSVASAEELGKIKQRIEKTVAALGREILNGNMDIAPFKLDNTHDACAFCEYKPICRSAN